MIQESVGAAGQVPRTKGKLKNPGKEKLLYTALYMFLVAGNVYERVWNQTNP